MNYPPRSVLLTAAAALFVAWFVVTRPLVALAFVVGGLCIVGFVTVVGAVGWLIFVWGADRSEPDLPADDIRRANPAVDRWVSRDGIAAELDADAADLPYGGGWGA